MGNLKDVSWKGQSGRVALLRCGSYDVHLIEQKLREGIELLGGDTFFRQVIPAGSSVLLKPNLLTSESPGSLVITDYRFFEAVVRVITDYATEISFGDSPGYGDPGRAAEKSGLLEVARRYGVKLADFRQGVEARLEEPLLVRNWIVARAALEADVLITVPRLKTHALAFLTGAVKNQFGCLPGLNKAAMHTRMPDPASFSKMLLDLNRLVGTSFAFLDGIKAMQGNGPRNGSPYQLNAIILGQSVTAVDAVAARLIGYDPLDVPALKEARNKGWGPVLDSELEVAGERLFSMQAQGFQLARPGSNGLMFKLFAPLLRSSMVPAPVLLREKCTGCRRCYEVCPVKPAVITMTGEVKQFPRWKLESCIRCFCCQELCPQGAIEARYTGLGRLFHRSR